MKYDCAAGRSPAVYDANPALINAGTVAGSPPPAESPPSDPDRTTNQPTTTTTNTAITRTPIPRCRGVNEPTPPNHLDGDQRAGFGTQLTCATPL